MDFDENFVYINVYGWENDGTDKDYYVRGTYEIDEANNSASINKDSFEIIINKWVTEAEAQEIDAAREKLQADYNALEAEIAPLRAMKLDVDKTEKEDHINSVLDEFSSELSNSEEFKNFRKDALEKLMDDEIIRKECFVFLGKVQFEQKSKKNKEKPLATFVKPSAATNKAAERYGSATRFFEPKN
jgi:hypothetical protein